MVKQIYEEKTFILLMNIIWIPVVTQHKPQGY